MASSRYGGSRRPGERLPGRPRFVFYTSRMGQKEIVSQYATSLGEVWWGGILVAATLVVHAFGMLWTLRWGGALKDRYQRVPTLIGGIAILIVTVWMITIVHILEVMVWAAFLQWKDCFANFSQAAYFALMQYTTVGSDYRLPENWRLLSGMIATSGLMGFAWSTGVLLTLAQEFQQKQLQLRSRKHANPVSPRE
jgi:MFS family permease